MTRLLIAVVYLTFITSLVSAQEFKLVWQDDFNGTFLNKTNWTVIEDGDGGGNKELQYYKRENVVLGKEPVSGAHCLILTAKLEDYKQKQCTSGRLSTQDKVTFKYGKIEARIKAPKTENGLWPAFWLMGNDISSVNWPKCGEIDVLEMGNEGGIKEGTQDRFFNGACHWGENWNNGLHPNFVKYNTSLYCLQDDFHLYTLIWDEKFIRMYLDLDKYPDNKPYYEMPISGEDADWKPAHYFHKEFYIIFNLAIGGFFTNILDINEVTALKNGDAKMYIDYVRLYQKGDSTEKFSQSIITN